MIFGVLHVALSTFLGFCFSISNGHLDSASAWVSLIVGALVAAVVTRQSWFDSGLEKKINSLDLVLLFFGAIVVFKHFVYLFYLKGASLRTLNPLNLGDLPLHISYIRQMASGAAFWPDNPIFSGEKLGYPLGMDLYNALWDRLGVSPLQHLPIVGLVMGISLLWSLNRAFGWLGIATYMFAFSVESPWKNFFLSMFVTQRGFLFAVPVGVLLLELAWQHFLCGRRFPRNHYIVLGFLWGILPLFHLHTFIAVSLVFLGAALASKSIRGAERILPWLALALPLTWVVSQGGKKASVIHWASGWMLEGRPLLISWMEHLHLWWILLYVSLWWLKKNKQEMAFRFLTYNLALWILFNFLILAPWEWDNLKILNWIFLAMLLPVAAELAKQRLEYQASIFAFCFLATLLIPSFRGKSSGPLDVWRGASGTGSSVELFQQEELLKSKEALSKLSSGPFMVLPTYNHPVGYWGRDLTMGYPGHIWSHGLNEGGREALVRKVYKGEVGWKDALFQLNPRYIVWSAMEKREFVSLNPEISRTWRKVADVQGFEVFEK